MPSPNFFDPLGIPGAERLRGSAKVKFTYDESGQPAIVPESAVNTGRSPDGSIDDVGGEFDVFYHCGHPRTQPLGSKCAVDDCNRLSCERCSVRCHRCLVPLCLEHANRLSVEGEELTFCSSCRAQVSRSLRWKAIGRFLLQPFVTTKNEEAS